MPSVLCQQGMPTHGRATPTYRDMAATTSAVAIGGVLAGDNGDVLPCGKRTGKAHVWLGSLGREPTPVRLRRPGDLDVASLAVHDSHTQPAIHSMQPRMPGYVRPATLRH